MAIALVEKKRRQGFKNSTESVLHFKTIIIVSKPLQRHLSFKSYNVPPRQEQAILTARKESLPAPNVPLMPHLNTNKERQALTCLFLLGWSFFFLFFYLYNISYSSFFLSFYFLILALPLINLILVWYFFFTRWGIFLTPTFIFFCIRHIKVTGFEPMALCTQNRCANQTALHLVSPPPSAFLPKAEPRCDDVRKGPRHLEVCLLDLMS